MLLIELVNSSNPDSCCSRPEAICLTISFFSSSNSYIRPAAYPVPAPRAAPPGPPKAPTAAPETVAAGVTKLLIEQDERLNSKAVKRTGLIRKKGSKD